MANPVRVKAEVVEVNNFYEGIVGYSFKPLGRIPRFAPGQFLHLTVEPFDQVSQWPESRVFSIASSPVDRELVKVIISEKGAYTKKIISSLSVGSYVWLKLPYGDFTFDMNNETLVLIGGGTGMAPFISFLEECVIEKPANHIHVYYGVRKYDHLVYHTYLNQLAGILPNLSVRIFVEDLGNTQAHENILEGVLNLDLIVEETKNTNADYYLSGPWLMIDHFRKRLLDNNIAENKIKIDEWS